MLAAHTEPRLLTGTEAVAKAALSNLLGGVGYFYGRSQVALPGGRTAWSARAGLLTAVPSRPFFPRGFMWDEGFHQVKPRRLIMAWLARRSRSWRCRAAHPSRAAICGTRASTRCPARGVWPDTLAMRLRLWKQGQGLTIRCARIS